MQSLHSPLGERFVRHGLFPLSVVVLIAFGACDDEDPNQTNTGPITTPGGLAGGSIAGTGGATGATAGTGGADAAVGSPTGGGTGAGVPTGGGTGAGAPTGGGTTGAGAPTGGTTGGSLDAGASPGGGADAGAKDGSATPTPDGGGSATGCTRELLKSTVDKYFVALAAHDAAMLPLASTAKFTENGETLQVGMGGLWKTAGMLKYQHSALDVQTCTSVSESVVPESGQDLPVGLRLKLVDGKITEIEHIVVREGDYTVFGFPFPSNAGDISASANRVKWSEPVAGAERTPRAEIERWTNKYFKMFPGGGCNLAPNCERRENGGGNFNCIDALSCADGEPGSGRAAMTPRLIVVDEELGIGVGFVMFQGHTDFHMMKFRGGTVYAVHAILSAATSPGWM
jgi:hypothetical protein